MNAPHLRASVVLPGHIGTSIVLNTARILGQEPASLGPEQIRRLRERLARGGLPVDGVSDDQLRQGALAMGEAFRDRAPTTAARAAEIILDGVRNGEWRILVGQDAEVIDEAVRQDPERAYEPDFFADLRARGLFRGLAV